MKSLSFTLLVLLLQPFDIAGAAQFSDKIIVCGTDISDDSNFYRFEDFRKNISLLPQDGSNSAAYEAIYQIYLERVTRKEERLKSVQSFLFMLEEIVAGLTSANLSVNENLDHEKIESDGRESARIHCDELQKNPSAIQDIAYIIKTINKINREGWYSLSKEVSRNVKLLSLRYDQWLENGIAIWPWEFYLNKDLAKGNERPENYRRAFFKEYQPTFFRPYVGFSRETDDSEDDKLKITLAIDLIGFIKYTRRDYSSHWGLSLIVAAPENRDTSFGVLLRKNNFALSLSRNQDDGSNTIFLGIDVLSLVSNNHPYLKRIRINAASSDGKN